MISRIRKLWLPTVLWNLFACSVIFVIGLFNANAAENVMELGLNEFSGWLKQLFASGKIANAPLWYMRAIFIFAFFAPLMYLMYKCLHWLIVVVLCAVSVFAYPHALPDDYPIYGLSLFMMGGLAAYHRFDFIGFVQKHLNTMLVWSLLSLVPSCILNFRADSVMEPLPMLKFACAPLFIVFAASLSGIYQSSIVKKWIAPAGFLIYVMHGAIFPCFMHSLGPMLPAGVGRMSIVSCLTIIFTIGVCTFTWHVLNRIFPRVLKVLDGRL